MCAHTRAHTHTTVRPAHSLGNAPSLHGTQPSRVEPAGQHLRHSMGTCPFHPVPHSHMSARWGFPLGNTLSTSRALPRRWCLLSGGLGDWSQIAEVGWERVDGPLTEAGLTRQSSVPRTEATSRPLVRPRSGAPCAATTDSLARATPHARPSCRPRSGSELLGVPGHSLRRAGTL